MTKVILSHAVGIVMVGAALSLAGCTQPDPCLTLPPPTKEELAAANSGAGVEREIVTEGTFGGEVECELVNGTWVREVETEG